MTRAVLQHFPSEPNQFALPYISDSYLIGLSAVVLCHKASKKTIPRHALLTATKAVPPARERLQVLIEQGSENVGDAGRKEPVRRYSLLSEDSCLILALIDLALLSRKEISVFLCSRAE